jgi:hypothetical protein
MNTEKLKSLLQWLRTEDGVAPKPDVAKALGAVLLPLLKEEGLQLFSKSESTSNTIDFAAQPIDEPNEGLTVAIEYKHYGRGVALNVNAVKQLLGAIASGAFNRAMLISRFSFTDAAKEAACTAELKLELHDLSTISAWIDRLEKNQTTNFKRVQLLVRSISHEFAKLVAANEETLEHLEWRDFERIGIRDYSNSSEQGWGQRPDPKLRSW